MSDGSAIQWTDATWNPVRGCSRVSEGCRHCYAEGVAARFAGPGRPYEGLARFTPAGPQWTGKIRLVPEVLEEPLRWKKPRRVFVNSMSDLFHEDVPDSFIRAVFTTMAQTPRHTYQVLTKRAGRMRELLTRWGESRLTLREGHGTVLPNVWLGVSVESQAAAYDRIPHLIETPAAVRFLSCEPLLDPIDLSPWLVADLGAGGRARLGLLHWVIVGGESGRGARPCEPDWIRSVLEQCREAGVPAFCKQLGAAWAHEQPSHPFNDAKGGDPDEWPADLRVRQWAEAQR
jgi:protein gp37